MHNEKWELLKKEIQQAGEQLRTSTPQMEELEEGIDQLRHLMDCDGNVGGILALLSYHFQRQGFRDRHNVRKDTHRRISGDVYRNERLDPIGRFYLELPAEMTVEEQIELFRGLQNVMSAEATPLDFGDLSLKPASEDNDDG